MERSGEKLARGLAQRTALAGRLAVARRSRGMSQAEVAAEVGVSVSYVSNVETGRDVPAVATLRRLAGVLGVPYNELAVLAGYADPPAEADGAAKDDPAADGAWFAGLPVETRRAVRELVERAAR